MARIAEALIKKIENCYTEIIQLYRYVPLADLVEPTLPNGWSVKDTLAHIAAWEWRCASLLSEVHETTTPLKAKPAVDALNLEIYQERRTWSWSEVEQDFREAHQALLESIRALPPHRLEDALVQRSIAEETWEHYEQHLRELRCWHEAVTGSRVAG